MEKLALLTVLFFSTSLFSFSQSDDAAKFEHYSRYFDPEKKFLQLPVKNGAPKRNIELWNNGERVRYFDIELASDSVDWYAYLDISEWKGQKVELRVDRIRKGSKTFSPVIQTDDDVNAGELYNEKYRGQFHFSQKRGWNNDPNGMAYYNGEYHLFFQHNPYGVNWGNMTWGHAVSKDLLHWTEIGNALHPDKFGTMFSGSGIVDSANTSGFGSNGKPPMVLFFTGAGSWAQGIAYTTDGRTFKKHEKAALPRVNKDNRDPKVIWHAPTGKWVMVLYVERDKGLHTMEFFTSADLKKWDSVSAVKGGIGNDRYLFECPEFFELPVDGNPNNSKWVLTGANSEYAIGTFDGKVFTPEAERLNGQRGRDFYAAQTFNNDPSGRRIEIGWWRTHTAKEGMIFNQSMSIPLELTLKNTSEGIRLARQPIKELETLRTKTYQRGKKSLTSGGANLLSGIDIELAEIRTEIVPGKASEVTLNVRGLPVVYDVAAKEISIDGVRAPAPLLNDRLNLIIYADRTGIELFTGDGLLFMPINKNLDPANRSLSISCKGGKVSVPKLDVYELKSIWKK